MGLIFEGFLLGNASILNNVCLLPLYPGMLAFLAGNADDENARRWRSAWYGVLVLLGILTMMLLIGMFFTVLSGLYGNLLPVIVIGSYILVVVFGGMMLLGYNPFTRLNTAQMPMLSNPFATAYVYGLLLAPMTLPCTGPLLLAALGRGLAADGALFSELTYFAAFGVGFGWPLLLLPLVAVGSQRALVQWTTRNHEMISRVAGVLLVAIGLFGLWSESKLFF